MAGRLEADAPVVDAPVSVNGEKQADKNGGDGQTHCYTEGAAAAFAKRVKKSEHSEVIPLERLARVKVG